MGQKSSKKTDLYVTDDVTHCGLPEDELNEFVGRAREYTTVNVSIEEANLKDGAGDKKQPAPPPHSIVSILNKAHRRGYHLSFIIPQVGSKISKLSRNSFIEEPKEPNETDAKKSDQANAAVATSHTVFLLRPKVKSRNKKEVSLKQMEAARTFLNVMLDIEQKWGFGIKEFTGEKSAITTGKFVEKLQNMISEEAKKGSRLLSVMVKTNEKNMVAVNGKNTEQINGDGEETKVPDGDHVSAKHPDDDQLTLRLVFFHNYEDDVSQAYEYSVACHDTSCTEQALKIKKKSTAPKSDRTTNITWTEDWLQIFQEEKRLIEVINVGEIQDAQEDKEEKSKKSKLRQFQVSTLCFYEKQVKTKGDEEKSSVYDGLARELWSPIDDNLQENLENEAENYGKSGWELCTALVTSHVRMKADGSEFRKFVVFFQRPKKEFVPATEKGKSQEDLTEDNDETTVAVNGETDETPSSPKDKLQKFGIAIMKVDDIDRTKLKARSPAHTNKPQETPAIVLPAVQLKKVNKDKPKKEEEIPTNQQVKLRPTEAKTTVEQKENDKEVPWLASLERKRKAVMESEDKSQQKTETKATEDVESLKVETAAQPTDVNVKSTSEDTEKNVASEKSYKDDLKDDNIDVEEKTVDAESSEKLPSSSTSNDVDASTEKTEITSEPELDPLSTEILPSAENLPAPPPEEFSSKHSLPSVNVLPSPPGAADIGPPKETSSAELTPISPIDDKILPVDDIPSPPPPSNDLSDLPSPKLASSTLTDPLPSPESSPTQSDKPEILSAQSESLPLSSEMQPPSSDSLLPFEILPLPSESFPAPVETPLSPDDDLPPPSETLPLPIKTSSDDALPPSEPLISPADTDVTFSPDDDLPPPSDQILPPVKTPLSPDDLPSPSEPLPPVNTPLSLDNPLPPPSIDLPPPAAVTSFSPDDTPLSPSQPLPPPDETPPPLSDPLPPSVTSPLPTESLPPSTETPLPPDDSLPTPFEVLPPPDEGPFSPSESLPPTSDVLSPPSTDFQTNSSELTSEKETGVSVDANVDDASSSPSNDANTDHGQSAEADHILGDELGSSGNAGITSGAKSSLSEAPNQGLSPSATVANDEAQVQTIETAAEESKSDELISDPDGDAASDAVDDKENASTEDNDVKSSVKQELINNHQNNTNDVNSEASEPKEDDAPGNLDDVAVNDVTDP